MSSKKERDGIPAFSEVDGAGVVVAIVLSGLFYFMGLKPLLDRQHTEILQDRQLEIQRAKNDQGERSLQTLREHLALVQAEIADSPQKLEPLHALNDRLARITALAAVRGLDIADIRPGAATTSLHYKTVPILLTGSGSYVNCVRYLHQLHEQFTDTTVTSLRMTGTPEDRDTAPSFQFELRWYAAAGQRVSTPAVQP